jgi:hypothetical protein
MILSSPEAITSRFVIPDMLDIPYVGTKNIFMARNQGRRGAAPHLLIGSGGQGAEFDVLASSSAVALESDPKKIVAWAAKPSIDLVILDYKVRVEPKEILAKNKKCEVVITHRLPAVLRELASHPRGAGVAPELVERLFWQFRSSATTAPESWLGTLVTRDRTAAEEAALRRKALLAAFEERRRLLADALTTTEVAHLLGSSRQTPHDRVKSKTLLGIEDNGQLRFPPWQFDASGPNGVLEGFSDVLQALAVGPLAQARWLTKQNASLDGLTPIAMLARGESQRVTVEARGVGASAGGPRG